MTHFYNVYQFAAPAVLFPLAYWLWLGRFGGDHAVTALIMLVPVVSYYVIAIVGIIRLRLWRINTRPTIKGLRPHHGFVIGAAAGLIAYLTFWLVPQDQASTRGVFTAAFVLGSVFGYWNWWYETYAVKSGFISLYTKKIAAGATPEEAVTDYAPIMFGSFGACHGALIKIAENFLLPGYSALSIWSVAIAGVVAMIGIPTALYLSVHRIRYGESGLRTYVDSITAGSGAVD